MRVVVLSWIGLCLLLKMHNIAALTPGPIQESPRSLDIKAIHIFQTLDGFVKELHYKIRNDVEKFTSEHRQSVFKILSRLEKKKTKLARLASKFKIAGPTLVMTVPVQEAPLDHGQQASSSKTPPSYSEDVPTLEVELPEYTPLNQGSERPESDQQITDDSASQQYLKCMQHNNLETITYVFKKWYGRSVGVSLMSNPIDAEGEKKRWTWLFALAKRSDQIMVRALSAECFYTASRNVMHQPKEGYPLPQFMFWAKDIRISSDRIDMMSVEPLLDMYNEKVNDFTGKQTKNVIHLIRYELYTQAEDDNMLDALNVAAAETFLPGKNQNSGIGRDFLTKAIDNWAATRTGAQNHELQHLLQTIEMDASRAQTLFKSCIGENLPTNVRDALIDSALQPFRENTTLSRSPTVLERNFRLARAADILRLIANSCRCFVEQIQ